MNSPAEQLLIGIHSVSSALKAASGEVEWLRIALESKNKRLLEIESRAHGSGIKVMRVKSSELDKLSGQQRHQGVIAGFKGSNVASEGRLEAILDQIGSEPLVLVLDGVQDPHNLGACLRTAEAAGVDLVVILQGSFRWYHTGRSPRCQRCCGGPEHCPGHQPGTGPAGVEKAWDLVGGNQ